MLKSLVRAVFGTRHTRELKRLQPVVDEINREFERLRAVSDDELRAQTDKFRALIREATAEVEAELADLRAQRRASEDAAEREGGRRARSRSGTATATSATTSCCR